MATHIPKGIDTLTASPVCDRVEHYKAFRRARRVRSHDKSLGWVGTKDGLHYFVYGAKTIFTVSVSKGWTESGARHLVR